MSNTLSWRAEATSMYAAPNNWCAVIKDEEGKYAQYPIAMFCICQWYESGEKIAYGSLISFKGEMVLAEKLKGFESIIFNPV